MSNTAPKPPVKDPSKLPTAEDVDRHLGQYSRYARVVRGAARVSGLSCRLSWSNQGWVEQFKLDDAVLGCINLVRVPPLASIPVSRAFEESLAGRPVPESVRHAVAKADGTQVKWVEQELSGPLTADTMAALISIKTELVRAGTISLIAADRPKETPRPELHVVRPAKAARARARTSKPVRSARPAKAKPAKKAVKKASKPLKAKKVARKPAAKAAKRAKRR